MSTYGKNMIYENLLAVFEGMETWQPMHHVKFAMDALLDDQTALDLFTRQREICTRFTNDNYGFEAGICKQDIIELETYIREYGE